MLRKVTIGIALGIALLFIGFQMFTFFSTVFIMETAVLPGEEDVVIRNGDVTGNQLAFTCNVDWGEDVIPAMLDIFKEKDIEITFFVTGQWAENHPTLLRKMYVGGHEIQNHGYGHKLSSKLSQEETRKEITDTEDIINIFLGVETTVFAPPSGDYNKNTVDLCREMGYTLSLWSVDTIDWRAESTASVIMERVLKKPLEGAIVLMHPKPETAIALPGLIDEIRKQGIEIVKVEDIIKPK